MPAGEQQPQLHLCISVVMRTLSEGDVMSNRFLGGIAAANKPDLSKNAKSGSIQQESFKRSDITRAPKL